GQVKAGKSSLINALSKEIRAAADALPTTSSFPAYQLNREGMPAALLIDSPGTTGDAGEAEALVLAAADCDLIVWVADASRADRERDRIVLDRIRRHFAERPNRRRPPMTLVLSHIDRLRPFQEWQPPYDLTAGDTPKARSIKAAIDAAGADLGFAAND